MNDISEEDIIEEYRIREYLWNRESPAWRNKALKSAAIEQIARKFKVTPNKIKCKWASIEKTFKEEHSKQEKSYKSGQGLEDTYTSRWPLFKSLSFLKGKITGLKTTGNLTELIENLTRKKEDEKNNFVAGMACNKRTKNKMPQGEAKLVPGEVDLLCSDLDFFSTLNETLAELAPNLVNPYKIAVLKKTQEFAWPDFPDADYGKCILNEEPEIKKMRLIKQEIKQESIKTEKVDINEQEKKKKKKTKKPACLPNVPVANPPWNMSYPNFPNYHPLYDYNILQNSTHLINSLMTPGFLGAEILKNAAAKNRAQVSSNDSASTNQVSDTQDASSSSSATNDVKAEN